MKLWEKNIPLNKLVESFTIGKDPEYDMELAPYDVLGSIAHAMMLGDSGLLTSAECKDLTESLREIHEVMQ